MHSKLIILLCFLTTPLVVNCTIYRLFYTRAKLYTGTLFYWDKHFYLTKDAMITEILFRYPQIPSCCLYIQEALFSEVKGFQPKPNAPLEKVIIADQVYQQSTKLCKKIKKCEPNRMTSISFDKGKMTTTNKKLGRQNALKFGNNIVVFNLKDTPVCVQRSKLAKLLQIKPLDRTLNTAK